MRLWQNAFAGWFGMRRHFPASVLDDIAREVAAGERQHLGEIRVVIESRLSLPEVFDGMQARSRAAGLFASLGVWDTEHNNGVLLYVLLAEHRIEVVADRGIAARVDAAEWLALSAVMRDRFAQGQWRDGVLAGVAYANALLVKHFPGDGSARVSELPDAPLIL
jgi:uncharacterized membrane protein